MQNRKEEQPRKESLLDRLVERARSKFFEQETYINIKTGILDSYGTFWACRDTIEESGLDPISLLPELIRSTKFSPSESQTVMSGVVNVMENAEERTWGEVFAEIAEDILQRELVSRYPEVEEELERRQRVYDEFIF